MEKSFAPATAEATEQAGAWLAARCLPPALIFLDGPLGAGKTTFTRGFLRALGHPGAVKSPTFTLVEEYHPTDFPLYHFDLYRLADPEELEYAGIRDYLAQRAIVIVEWPDQGAGVLPPPDWRVQLAYQGTGRRIDIRAEIRK